MPTLNSNAITEDAVVNATLALFQEWVATFFDGNPHAIGFGPAKPFPTADVKFQEGAHPQPLPGIGIRMTWVRPGKAKLYWEWVLVGGQRTRQPMASQPATWMFWVRASGTSRKDAQLASENAAGLLYAILQNAGAWAPLSPKGIHHVRCEQPQLGGTIGDGAKQADPFYCLRNMQATGVLRYPVISQDPTKL